MNSLPSITGRLHRALEDRLGMAYGAPGGVLGVIADWVAARQVGSAMTKTLENLQKLAEV